MSLNQSFISDVSEFPRSLDVRMDEDMVSICKSTKCLRVSILEHLAFQEWISPDLAAFKLQ